MRLSLRVSPTRTSYLAGPGPIPARISENCDAIARSVTSRWCPDRGRSLPNARAADDYCLWVAGYDDVWVGGASIWHFDGKSWRETPPPIVTHIESFWGFTPDDIWATGSALPGRQQLGSYAVLHWDGVSWSVVTPNNGVSFNVVFAIWGSSPNDVWITDEQGLDHYDGQLWTRSSPTNAGETTVWGTSKSNIWLTTDGPTYHFDGTTWAQYQAGPSPFDATGFWADSPDDVWSASELNSIMRWDGSSWTSYDQFAPNARAYSGIWGSGPEDIYAVGVGGHVAHYDGHKWTTKIEIDSDFDFLQIQGASRGDIWATARQENFGPGVVLRYQP